MDKTYLSVAPTEGVVEEFLRVFIYLYSLRSFFSRRRGQ